MSIIVKSGVPGKVPQARQLEYGQLALNYKDQKIYFKNADNQVVEYTSEIDPSVLTAINTSLNNKLDIGQYGFGASVLPQGFTDLNTVEARTMRFMGHTLANAPRGFSGWFLVDQLVHNADWITQIAYGMAGLDGCVFIRQRSVSNGWGAWRNIATHREPAISLTGNTLDISLGTDFYKSISANTTITISNAGGGAGLAQAASLIVNHTGGTITFLATGHTIRWAGGTAPTLATGRWHQFFIWPDPLGASVLISCVSYY